MKIIKPFGAVALLVAGGCSEAAAPATTVPPSVAAAAAAASSAGRIGTVGGACEMPLSFDLTADGKPSAVDLESPANWPPWARPATSG